MSRTSFFRDVLAQKDSIAPSPLRVVDENEQNESKPLTVRLNSRANDQVVIYLQSHCIESQPRILSKQDFKTSLGQEC
jgi:hypothetical protein